jgi:hypothetical protein
VRKTPAIPRRFVRQLEKRQRQIHARLDALAWVRPALDLAVREHREIDALLTLYDATPQEVTR